jgi:hypothetical protein
MSLSPFYFKADVDSDGWYVGVYSLHSDFSRTAKEPAETRVPNNLISYSESLGFESRSAHRLVLLTVVWFRSVAEGTGCQDSASD